MKATTVLQYLLTLSMGILAYSAGYSTGYLDMKNKVVYKLYHPFEEEYLKVARGNCSTNDLENLCPELLQLEERAWQFRHQQSLFKVDPLKEFRTLERLERLMLQSSREY